MGISGISPAGGGMAVSQASLMQQVGTSVLKMAMDQTEQTGDSMIKMMEQSVNPNLGQNLDIRC